MLRMNIKNEINRDAIEKFYDLLDHTKQTEIRVFKPSMSFFVKSKEEFTSKVVELNTLHKDVYAGINERDDNGTTDNDVKNLGLLMIDFDAHDDANAIVDLKQHVLDLQQLFKNSNIIASIDSSGRGFHLLLPFKKVDLHDDNRTEIKQKIDSFKDFLVDKFGVDSKTFNFSRVCRVTGTVNMNNNTISEWIEFNGRKDNLEFFTLLDSIYQNSLLIKTDKGKSQQNIDSVEGARVCKFFDDISIAEKFPQGERHALLVKNLAVYTNYKPNAMLRKSFCEKQEMSAYEFEGWDKKFQNNEFRIFNCGEVMNYCKKNNIPDVCSLCPYNNFRFNDKKFKFIDDVGSKANFVVDKLAYQRGKAVFGAFETRSNEVLYNIFRTTFFIGEKKKFCLTINSSDLREGDAEHYLMPLKHSMHLYELFLNNPPEQEFLIEVASKDLKYSKKQIDEIIKTGSLFDFLVDEDKKNLDAIFYCLSYGVDENAMLGLSNDDAKKIVDDYITLGLEVDSKVVLAFEPDFFVPDVVETDFRTYQYYNPHKFVFTGTKAAKTSISSRIGHNAIRSTAKNLLGFATGDEINRGTLHNNIYPYYLDEMQEDDSKSLYGKLLSFMELGNVNIDVGKKSITCRGLSTLTFLGNPKDDVGNNYQQQQLNSDNLSDIEIVNQFNTTLNLITNNYAALGSRIGIVIFDPNTKRVSGTAKYLGKNYDDLLAKFEFLRYVTSKKFSILLKDDKVLEFLNTRFDDNYVQMLLELSAKAEIKSLKDFLNGNVDSFRHLNGFALRMAALEMLGDVINDTYKIDYLIERAKYYLTVGKTLNLDSFKTLSQGETVKTFFAKHYKNEFEQQGNDTKTLLSALYCFTRDKGQQKQIFASELYEYIENDTYRHPGRQPKEVVGRVNPDVMMQLFNISIGDIDGAKFFVIRDAAVLEYIFGKLVEKTGQQALFDSAE